MSKPKHKPFSDQWIVNIPELETRPNLLEAMVTRRDLRRKVFQASQDLESIALIPSKHVAIRCLALFWRETKKELYKYCHDKLREQTGTDTLFNELYGCLRNVYWNMRVKAGDKYRRHSSERNKKGEVIREYIS